MPSEVTCPVSWRGRAVAYSGVIDAAANRGKVEGSQERLLSVRARLIRASSSEINSGLRRDLLAMIEEGRWGA